jgi:hypothetical protein
MLQAMFPPLLIENVPIDRVIQNLERRVSANPGDINSRINLARVHAMAYASKTETAPVRKARAGDPPSSQPFFQIECRQFLSIFKP